MRRNFRTACCVSLLIALLGACDPPAATDRSSSVNRVLGTVPQSIPSPAGPGSAEPRLFSGPGGTHMSWLEPSAGGHAVRLSTLRGTEWSPPTTVIEADDLFVNWADFPSVVETTTGDLVVHWLQRSGEGTYAYDVRISRSRDGGATWSEPRSPHDDGTQTEHGFVTLVPEADGAVTAVWLDGRNTVAGEGGHGGGAMTLRTARLGADGVAAEGRLLDARTCDCCQTGATAVGDDLLVVYRDRSDDEIRDIWSVARRDGEWEEPQPLSHDNWMIPGCPVNGPVVTARNNRVVAAWFALVDGAPETKAVFSDDAGRSFSEPLLLERGTAEAVTLGRVDAAWIDDDTALLVWLTGIGEQAEIRYQTVDADGTRGETGTVAVTRSTRSSGFPRIAVEKDRVVFVWTMPGDPSAILAAALPLS